MAVTLHAFAVETLCDRRLDEINFQFGSLRVYPSGYRTNVASCITNGTIELTSDPARLHSTGPLDHDGAFAVDTPPGTTHPFFVNPRWTEQLLGRLCVRPTLCSRDLAYVRGIIVHESTHALQDWQHAGASSRTAEGAAYLAGAIASRLWGYAPVWPITDPYRSGISFSQVLAVRYLAMGAAERYLVPLADVATLERLVRTGAAARYDFNGI